MNEMQTKVREYAMKLRRLAAEAGEDMRFASFERVTLLEQEMRLLRDIASDLDEITEKTATEEESGT